MIMVMSPVVKETSGVVGSGAAAVSTQLLTRGGGGGRGGGSSKEVEGVDERTASMTSWEGSRIMNDVSQESLSLLLVLTSVALILS